MGLLHKRAARLGDTTFYVALKVYSPYRWVAWTVIPHACWHQGPLETRSEFIRRVRGDIRRGYFPFPPKP